MSFVLNTDALLVEEFVSDDVPAGITTTAHPSVHDGVLIESTGFVAAEQVILLTGIASAEAFGTAAVTTEGLILPVGIPSAEAFGADIIVTRAPVNVFITPFQDTLRGGAEVTIYADSALTTTQFDESFTNGVPATWINNSAFSGSVIRDARLGVLANTGPTPNSVAGMTCPTSFDDFDIAIDAEIIGPPNGTAEYTYAALEAVINGGATQARVRVIRQTNGALVVRGDVVRGSVIEPGGTMVLAPTRRAVTLRLVRVDTHMYGFVGTRGDHGDFDELQQVLAAPTVATGLAAVRFATRNLGTTTAVRTRWSNFTVRSHAAIAYRLLTHKIDAEERRLIAHVPAAPLADLGFQDVQVFGPWGATTLINGFEYVLPLPATLSNDGSRTLTMYNDPILHDATLP